MLAWDDSSVSKYGPRIIANGGTPETEKLCNAVTKIFEDLMETLEKVAECIEKKDVLEDKDFSEALKTIEGTVNALPLPRE